MSFELKEDDLEATNLYPDYKYTSVDGLLSVCTVDPPKPKLAAFAWAMAFSSFYLYMQKHFFSIIEEKHSILKWE